MFETGSGLLAEEMKDATMMVPEQWWLLWSQPKSTPLPGWLVSSPQFNFSSTFHLNAGCVCLQPNLKVMLPKCTHSMLNRNVYNLPWQSVSAEWHVHWHLVIAKISNGCCQSGLRQECLGITETAWSRTSHRCSTQNQNKHNPCSRAARSRLSLPGVARVFGCQNNKCLHWRAVHSAWERAGRDSSSCRDMTAVGSVQAMGPGSSQHTSAVIC